MFDTIYVGMTGLEGYSKGLNVISNNVANLNTPGFKSSQLQFADLFYEGRNIGADSQGTQQQIGEGLGTGGTFLNFGQGETRQTGNDLDVAIDGLGLLVLRKDDKTVFTRAGQLQFDGEGYLVDRTNQARVAGLGSAQQLLDISITGLRTHPPRATSSIKLADNLSTGDNQHVLSNMTVFDAVGGSHTLKVTFDNDSVNAPGEWIVTVSENTTTVATGRIAYKDGRPVAGKDTLTFTYQPVGGTAMGITLDLRNETTGFAEGSDSTLKVLSQDGYAPGALSKTSFDSEGYLVTTYSNGQTVKRDRLALAWFDDMNGLQAEGGNVFVNRLDQPIHLGWAAQGLFGKVVGGSIEVSNVELSQQFSDLIITQRGYQASSQVITTANEMIQQLFDMRGKR